MWPKFDDKSVGEKLAFIGSVKDDVVDTEHLAGRLLEFLRDNYSSQLCARYKLSMEEIAELQGYDILETVGKKRGMLISGGEINTERAAMTVLDEFRNATLGKITLDKADEAGRGPLAGPVCAAAVIFPKGLVVEGIDDSKKLTEKKREKLFDIIKEKALAYSIAWASVEEIEEINILNAAMLAMKRAIESLPVKADFAMIDGNKTPKLDIPSAAIIKGDALSQSIGAASILAKVSRDRLMLDMAKKYPEYGFEKHKGYGTQLHRDMLLKYGPCEIHRMSFLGKILNQEGNKP